MPYAIMRFAKRKGGPAGTLEKHHERKKDRYGSNPDIDTERSGLNYHLVEPRMKYYAEIQSRIEKAQRKNPRCKVRKDSVKFIDTIVTATETPKQDAENSGGNTVLVIVLVVLAVAGGAVYFLKFRKRKPDTRGSDDLDEYDYGDEDDEELPDTDAEDEDE